MGNPNVPSVALLKKNWGRFEKALRKHIAEATEDFDAAVGVPSAGSSVWRGVPVVDSKTVAKASPIFESMFGVKLDPKWIKRGGYGSTDEAVGHLKSEVFKSALKAGAAAPRKVHRVRDVAVAARRGQ